MCNQDCGTTLKRLEGVESALRSSFVREVEAGKYNEAQRYLGEIETVHAWMDEALHCQRCNMNKEASHG